MVEAEELESYDCDQEDGGCKGDVEGFGGEEGRVVGGTGERGRRCGGAYGTRGDEAGIVGVVGLDGFLVMEKRHL